MSRRCGILFALLIYFNYTLLKHCASIIIPLLFLFYFGDGQPVSDRLCLMINERVMISCIVSDLEKDNVLRTKRAFDCLSRLYQRSM